MWINEQNWTIQGEKVFLVNQEAKIQSKNIMEKITFDGKNHKLVTLYS